MNDKHRVFFENGRLDMRKITLWLTVLLIVGIAILLVVANSKYSSLPRAAEVTIGVAAAFSGPVSFWAQSILQGMQLATDEYNAAHPERKAKIIFEDNGGEANKQIGAMRKLCTTDHVSCVVSVLTPYSKPLRPLAEQFETPLLGTVVASLDFGSANSWCFRDYPTPDQLSAKMADHAHQVLNLRRAVSLVVNDEYGTDSLNIFRKAFENLGGKLLGSDTVTQTDTDMRAQVTKLLQMNPDCVFLVIRENALGTAVRQFRELGFQGQILGINAFDSPVVWDVCGSYGDGIIFTSVLIDYDNNPEAAAFLNAFRKRFGKNPMHTHAYGYSIAKYLLPMAAKTVGNKHGMKTLLTTLDTDSVRGRIKMAPSRDVLSSVAIYKRVGDKNVIVGQ